MLPIQPLSIFKRTDWLLSTVIILLAVFGLAAIYSIALSQNLGLTDLSASAGEMTGEFLNFKTVREHFCKLAVSYDGSLSGQNSFPVSIRRSPEKATKRRKIDPTNLSVWCGAILYSTSTTMIAYRKYFSYFLNKPFFFAKVHSFHINNTS